MWILFKLINIFWLLISTNAWFVSMTPFTLMLFLANAGMMVCIGMLPIRIEFNGLLGRVMLAIIGIVLWTVFEDGYIMGIIMLMSYLPVTMLIMLPIDYQKDLLNFVTKWMAIMIGISFIEYLATVIIDLPSLGTFIHPNYSPYDNYGLYIENTNAIKAGIFVRFGAFFLEPGHLAMLSTFLLIANDFKIKNNPYCWILLVAILFSFSLAGYLLLFTGWGLTWINNIKRAVLTGIVLVGAVTFIVGWDSGDNAFNELIISRLEYDQEKGIKGNNRFTDETDYVFQKGQKNGWNWVGMKDHANLELIDGAGYKIFIVKNGWIGAILALLLYLSVIPPKCNVKYTAVFLTVIILCFIQRAYPYTYTWLFPYVIGIYSNRRIPSATEELQTNT